MRLFPAYRSSPPYADAIASSPSSVPQSAGDPRAVSVYRAFPSSENERNIRSACQTYRLSIDDARKRTKNEPRPIFERTGIRRFRANSVFLAKRQKFGALPVTFLLTCGIVIGLLMCTVFLFPDSPRRVLSQIGCDCTLTWLYLPGSA